MAAAMETGATAIPIPLERPLPLTPVAVGAHLWYEQTESNLNASYRDILDRAIIEYMSGLQKIGWIEK